MGNDSNDQPKDGTKDAGWVQDQAVFQVNHKDNAKVNDQNQPQKISKFGRRLDPGVNACGEDDDLDNPQAHFARMSILTGSQQKIILPAKGSAALRAGGLAETPRDRQDICQVIHEPSGKHPKYDGYDQSDGH